MVFLKDQFLVLLFLICIFLPKVLIQNALPILFADNTSIIVTDSHIIDFQLNMRVVFEQLNNWLNLLLLNFEKKGLIHFKTKNACEVNSIFFFFFSSTTLL